RSPGPGGEVERIREAAAPAVAETQGPEVVLAERLTRSEFKHSFEGTVHRVEGIDPVVPAVVPDEQITAELAETLGRDGQSPGVVQPLACWVVDQRLDEGTVGLELIHDAARGNTLVRVRDEEGLCPVDAEILDVERGIAGWELRKIRVRESSRQLPLAVEDVDVAAVLVGGVDLNT